MFTVIKTRPVCLAKVAPNNVLSHILAQILKPVGDEADNNAVFSTEEIIAMLKKVNSLNLSASGKKIGVGSMDVKALYPSLVKEWVKRILMEMLLETEVKVAGINWRELALYLANTHEQEEIDQQGLTSVVHTRRNSGNKRPGVTSARTLRGENPGDEEMWILPESH